MKDLNTTDLKHLVKIIKKQSREQHKDMPTGGVHGSKKGKKGYTRNEKHKKKPGEQCH